jgi:hypothetical protein
MANSGFKASPGKTKFSSQSKLDLNALSSTKIPRKTGHKGTDNYSQMNQVFYPNLPTHDNSKPPKTANRFNEKKVIQSESKNKTRRHIIVVSGTSSKKLNPKDLREESDILSGRCGVSSMFSGANPKQDFAG